MIKILIAEDHKILIDGIKALVSLTNDIEVIESVLDGKSAVDFCKKNDVDVIVMDINMPYMDGLEASKIILSKNPNQKIVVLTSYSADEMIKEVFRLGVKGFLSKSSAGEYIINAIRKVAKGEYFADSRAIECLVDHVKENVAREEEIFTEKELSIVGFLCEEYSSREMARELSVSIRTIENYKKKIMKKINVKNTIGIVLYAHKNNLYPFKKETS